MIKRELRLEERDEGLSAFLFLRVLRHDREYRDKLVGFLPDWADFGLRDFAIVLQ